MSLVPDGVALSDRVAALFAEVTSIRDVIAFPKTAAGTDLMLNAPSPVTEAQLKELHIALRKENVAKAAASVAVMGEGASDGGCWRLWAATVMTASPLG